MIVKVKVLRLSKSKLKNPTLNHDKLIFIPYKSIGDFELNCSLSDVIRKYDISNNVLSRR